MTKQVLKKSISIIIILTIIFAGLVVMHRSNDAIIQHATESISVKKHELTDQFSKTNTQNNITKSQAYISFAIGVTAIMFTSLITSSFLAIATIAIAIKYTNNLLLKLKLT